jgi:hypothetical protein
MPTCCGALMCGCRPCAQPSSALALPIKQVGHAVQSVWRCPPATCHLFHPRRPVGLLRCGLRHEALRHLAATACLLDAPACTVADALQARALGQLAHLRHADAFEVAE